MKAYVFLRTIGFICLVLCIACIYGRHLTGNPELGASAIMCAGLALYAFIAAQSNKNRFFPKDKNKEIGNYKKK